MNFQQIEYVIAVDKTKHFGLAAEQCHITQATLSAMVKKLEEELNVILFDRSRKPIKTTQAGLAFIEIGKEVLKSRNAFYELGNNDKKLKGKISIGIIPTIATSLLPLILPELLSENPALNLEIIELTTDEIKKQLFADNIDFGIFATPSEEDDLEENILYYESMMVYGLKDIQKEYVSSDDIKEGNVWLLEEGHCFRNQVINICELQEKKSAYQNLDFKGSSFETLLNLTDRLGGFTLLPELYHKSLSEERIQKTKAFTFPVPVREVSLVSYRPIGKQFIIDYLTEKIKTLITPYLSTSDMKNKDMDIIGIL